MADNTIAAGATLAKTATGSAYWDAACAFEMVELDAERASETAFALAASETFDSNAQSAFYAMGQLIERLQKKCKFEGDRLTTLSEQQREATQ